ncbi:MAG: PAS domain-containing sensor histidine kinase, partial [Gemmatimonadetes bacterium]|nr:PAS domain-containing sensor histidine kinase [Gemmatimonadota bacterium]NIT68448.1 PAS domain-containing sensor histidine kinase [Gemmatimonadota bacterium]NIV25009.1 PAS domain-containing sensor histidine kinase [Gemmatimonadota bacterium]NIW77001.1 PAS domain-containing sensor histidine kinase [Gemmatimonadota bacterium]NIY37025.1 PAS domain-containing sensor histidine kinase [Gemmatimonadota bacterium]
LQTIANMLAALREGDYSIRGRGKSKDDALGLALMEISTLGETLRGQRLGAMEATALLERVMEEIEVAIFAFDREERLVLVNRAGRRLLAKPEERLLGRHADALGLSGCLEAQSPTTMDLSFPGSMGRWEVRRTNFRQGGEPHRLLVLSDLSRALRE